MRENKCIGCIVSECKHHSNEANYCTLNQIKITKHGANIDSTEGTDCASFERK